MLSFFLLCLSQLAHAGSVATPLPVPPETKAHTDDVGVKESVVLLHGQRFRRIETKSESFYLRLESPDAANPPDATETPVGRDNVAGGRSQCLRTNEPLDEADARVVEEVKITEVASLYLEALHDRCTSFDPRREVDGQVGVKIRTGDQSDVKVGFGAASAPKAALSPFAPPPRSNDLPTTTNVGPEVKFNLKF